VRQSDHRENRDEAGHGAGKPTTKLIDEAADRFLPREGAAHEAHAPVNGDFLAARDALILILRTALRRLQSRWRDLLLDWAVRTGRSAIQRRCAVLSLDWDPIIAPIERKVVLPATTGRGSAVGACRHRDWRHPGCSQAIDMIGSR